MAVGTVLNAIGSVFGAGGGGGDNPFTVAAAVVDTSWKAVLAGLVGSYSVVRQYQLLVRQTDLAERGVDQAEDYLDLAKDAYANISIPTFTRHETQFDRYVSGFAGYEDIYMVDAFSLKAYTPEYTVQMGRTIGAVSSTFDKAALQRKRQNGKYNTGRACADSLWFATMKALAIVDAVNHGYRYEDNKKILLDQWYWSRISDGARMNEAHAGRVVSGLNGGAAISSQGLSTIGSGVNALTGAIGEAARGYENRASSFNSIANGAFRALGDGYMRTNGFMGATGDNSWTATKMPNAMADPKQMVGMDGWFSTRGASAIGSGRSYGVAGGGWGW